MEKITKKQVKKIVNLTGHEVTVGDVIIPRDRKYKYVPRCKVTKNLTEILEFDGREIEVYQFEYGDVGTIPNPEEGTIYLVSYPVAKKLNRNDVYCMGEVIRDEKKNIIGAMSLSKVKNEKEG